jgi:quercetin dioxygenase-like cupin family protein
MYTIENIINETASEGLKASKIKTLEAKEILLITLEAGHLFPTHTSPRDAHLLMIEGSIDFYINDTSYHLETHQMFDFEKETEHWVKAISDSKFLIIR